MKKILITGALGQIGSELTRYLGDRYGSQNVIATSRTEKNRETIPDYPFEILNVLDGEQFRELVVKHRVDTIIHLAAILSAKGESMPETTWQTNMGGLINALEVAKSTGVSLFTPSSIAVFGELTPKENTPQDTIMRPGTMYGVTKVSGELLCDYYHKKFGTDTRGIRFPGIISHRTLPGSGTTDYAVHIYYEAVRDGRYTCYIKKDTFMDMIYMPDALRATVELMEANPEKLMHRNAFNVTSMSLEPSLIAREIQKHIPHFSIEYEVDPIRQEIAESWPNEMDDSCAREEWGWMPEYDLKSMTEDMLVHLEKKLAK